MSIDIRLPNINARTDSEKISQLSKYLYQLTEQLNFSLNTIETTVTNQYPSNTSKRESSSLLSEEEKLARTYQSVKDMIIKSADMTQSLTDEVQSRLSGSYVATSEFGEYLENTTVEINGNSVGFTQLYDYTAEVRSKFGDFNVGNQSYIKTGLLYYDGTQPVYGVGIGILEATIDANGENVLKNKNRLIAVTSEEISFWGNDNKLAYITPTQVYFPSGKLTAYDATITGNITATDGDMGGWSISRDKISKTYKEDGQTFYVCMNTFLYHGENNQFQGMDAIDNSTVFEVDINGSPVFYVRPNGELHAEKGKIGGWIIESSYIRSPSGAYGTYGYDGTMSVTGYLFTYLMPTGIRYRVYSGNDVNSTLKAEFDGFSMSGSGSGGSAQA